MAWTNLLTYDPATVFDVYRNGSLIAPGDYALMGVAVTVDAGRATLEYPSDDNNGNYALLARPSAPVAFDVRLLDADGNPWDNGFGGNAIAAWVLATELINGFELADDPPVTAALPSNPYVAFGMALNQGEV